MKTWQAAKVLFADPFYSNGPNDQGIGWNILSSQQRLAESFEASLRIADGRAIALEMDSGKEHLFSSKFGCPVCSYSLPKPFEPRELLARKIGRASCRERV